jgi:glutathione-specific gamma-glutamylcyclotransferase
MPAVNAAAESISAEGGLWIFGYGSLMWRPGFNYRERHVAVVRGYHRALCIYSHVHRGTPERPGLVLGLDRGGSCKGIVYGVAEKDRREILAYLRAREQATAVYLERLAPAVLADGRQVLALAYVADRDHRQYAGKLSRHDLLRLVRQGYGISGGNPDYVRNTHDHLAELGFADETLAWLATRLSNNDC